MNLDPVFAHIRQHRESYVSRFKEALAIPSISTFSENKGDMQEMATWFAEQMRAMGLENVALMPTSHNPVVYGDWLHAPGKPCLLVYGHYDVQPCDPLHEWTTPPFDPAIRDDNIYARGASDMKGQIFAQLMAVESMLQVDGELPINIKYLIEGDEEVGSPGLEAFIREHKELLHCDAVVNCDSIIHAVDAPSLVYALRGLACFELRLFGQPKDVHSGMFGGIIRNPLHVLCKVLAGMHDDQGRITLPGLYDTVRPLDDEERAVLKEGPYDDAYYLKLSGASKLYGESGFTPVERLGARPSLDINGIWGGFQGEGSKTVLPASCGAKFSLRLVADQGLDQVVEQVKAYMKAAVPQGYRYELIVHSLGPGAIMDRKAPAMRAAATAIEMIFKKKPFFRREGASVPVVALMQQQLGVDSVMLGFGLPEDGIHGPDEHQSLPLLFQGMECYAQFMKLLAL
ncbi:MAG: dipeptidase [Candidatus Hydrogenedentes bacterium]|jgi:acetylornithine deacetylase/succinyl-diaminopimelate desuccinylase-like protein|nr:dipeptidase [Candidatus Hydrogenedentota bacterium]